MEARYKTLVSNTITFTIGNLLIKLVAFILMPLYTSVLTTSQYGTAELLNNTIEIVLPITTLCMCEALFRFSIDKDAKYKLLFSNAICVVFIGIIIVSFACLILRFCIGYEYSFHFLILFIATTFYKFTTEFARGMGHVKRYVLYGVTNSLVLITSNIVLLVVFHGGVKSYLFSYILGYFFAGILAFNLSKEYQQISIKEIDKSQIKEMLRYSLPNIPNKLSWWVNHLFDRYLILFFLGSATTGLYTAASKLPGLINVVDSIFHQAWQYSSSAEIESKDSGKFFSNVFRVYVYFCLLTCGFLIVINKPVCRLLLKSEFYSSWIFVPLLLMAATFGCISSFFGTFCNALKNNMLLMWSTVAGAITNIILNLILIPMFSGMGAAVATLISYAVIVIIRIIKIKKIINIEFSEMRLFTQIGILFLSVILGSFKGTSSFVGCILCCILLIITDLKILKIGTNMIVKRLKKLYGGLK